LSGAVAEAVISQDKKKVAVITGGWSGEREISLASAKAMVGAMQETGRYEIFVVEYSRDLIKFLTELDRLKPDVALLAIHGVGAEDGILQGILEVAEIPYSSSSVVSSALAMDKVFSRIIMEREGICSPEWGLTKLERIKRQPPPFEYPYVIKPRNEGSSIGVSIIHNQEDLEKALSEWGYGETVLAEKYIKGQEIQVAVICGKAIGAMEIKPHAEFFDYHAKYTEGATEHIFPPQIPFEIYSAIMCAAERVFNALECSGIARVEFIYGNDGKMYFLELNTQPGMTGVSIIPDIVKHFGISYGDIINTMIREAKTHARGKN
jgi:D-alanine-D-alanine ligase